MMSEFLNIDTMRAEYIQDTRVSRDSPSFAVTSSLCYPPLAHHVPEDRSWNRGVSEALGICESKPAREEIILG